MKRKKVERKDEDGKNRKPSTKHETDELEESDQKEVKRRKKKTDNLQINKKTERKCKNLQKKRG